MESILGQKPSYIFCSRYTVLADELSKVNTETTTLVISCLSGIVTSLMSEPDVKTSLEKTMASVGSMLHEIVKDRARMRVIVVHCTPRNLTDYETHSKYAMVIVN